MLWYLRSMEIYIIVSWFTNNSFVVCFGVLRGRIFLHRVLSQWTVFYLGRCFSPPLNFWWTRQNKSWCGRNSNGTIRSLNYPAPLDATMTSLLGCLSFALLIHLFSKHKAETTEEILLSASQHTYSLILDPFLRIWGDPIPVWKSMFSVIRNFRAFLL